MLLPVSPHPAALQPRVPGRACVCQGRGTHCSHCSRVSGTGLGCGFTHPRLESAQLGGRILGPLSALQHCPPQADTGNAGNGRREPASQDPPGAPATSLCARPAPCPVSLCALTRVSEREIAGPPVPPLKSEHLQHRQPGSPPPPNQSSFCSSCRQPPAPEFEISETKLVL